MSDNETETVTTEVAEWFFDDYLPTWVGVGNGDIDTGPGFILNYWVFRSSTITPTVASGHWTAPASPGSSTKPIAG